MEFVDETHRIASIDLAELTGEQAKTFFNHFADSPLSTLTVLYDEAQDMILLNRSNCRYEAIRSTVTGYLSISEDDREKVRDRQDVSQFFKEIFAVLDIVCRSREIKREMDRLQYQNWDFPRGIRNAIQARFGYSKDYAAYIAYQYGVMRGKRMERSRKRKGGSK